MKNINEIGSPYSKDEIKKFVGNHVKAAKAVQENNYAQLFLEDETTLVRKAELFGRDIIDKLLSKEATGKDVAGIRIYWGLAWEHKEDEETILHTQKMHPDAKSKPRLFLVPVDADGNDIDFDQKGLKDGPNGAGAGNGDPCPPTCTADN